MKTAAPITLIALLVSFGTAAAQVVKPDDVNNASLASIAAERPAVGSKTPDPAIIRLQVLLDRAGASPGVIDGIYGDNVSKAVAGFEAINDLKADGKVGPDVVSRLQSSAPIIESYLITADDAAGLVDHIPEDYGEKAKMPSMGYTSVAEKLAERFHMAQALLETMNAGTEFVPGKTIQVAMPGEPKQGRVKRIEANKKTGQVFAYGENDIVLAVYPATVGSDDNPSPSGTHKVKGVAHNPVYRYDPSKNFKQGKNDKVLIVPKGPNGPVGSVWIDLTEPTYGIHGTPDPDLIGKVGSHGCVRLANWDAEELAGMVKPGVVVKFDN
ncbi:MAG: L,D-transpeptidase family protein [Rhizobium sp.]